MSCAICLESYLDQSLVPVADKLPYLHLDKENFPPPGSPPPSGSQKSQNISGLSSPKGSKDKENVDTDAAVVTKCGHVFHLSCITNWSDTPSKERGCPICRETIVLKNLIKLHLDTMNIIRQDTAIGVLVSMSVNQYNTLKDGFTLGYRNGEEKFTEVFQAKVEAEKRLKEQAEKEILDLKTENAAAISKLETENAATASKLKTENADTTSNLETEKKLKEQALDEVSKLKSEQETAVSEFKKENLRASNWRTQYKNTVDKLQAERRLKVEAQDEMLKLKNDHAAEMEKLKSDHAGEIQKLKGPTISQNMSTQTSGIKRKWWKF